MFSYSLNRYKEHMPASNQDLDSAREKMFDARRHSDSVARTIPQHTFAYAQRAVNPYELVQHLDNGENMWPRSFYTILELAALFPALRSAATAKTLHLCEAPGFFATPCCACRTGRPIGTLARCRIAACCSKSICCWPKKQRALAGRLWRARHWRFAGKGHGHVHRVRVRRERVAGDSRWGR